MSLLQFVLLVDHSTNCLFIWIQNFLVFSIAPLHDLLTHFRFHLNLRSQEGYYHSLILFRLSSGLERQSDNEEITPLESESSVSGNAAPKERQIYVMESTCPHLGADLSHAEIEECESSVVAVCPWHRFVNFIYLSNVVIRLKRLVGMTSIWRLGRVKRGWELALTLLKSGMTLKTVLRKCSWNLLQEEVTGV